MQEHRDGPAMWEIAHMLWLENCILLAVDSRSQVQLVIVVIVKKIFLFGVDC